MLFVGLVFFPLCLVPIVVGREECVCFGGNVVNLRQAETVGQWHCLRIDGCAADDVDVFVG